MDTRELYRYISEKFSSEEMMQLCMELDVDYENFPGGSKNAIARELVTFMKRRGRLSELEALCLQERQTSNTQEASPSKPAPVSPPQQTPPFTPTASHLNPYTMTKFLHIFFEDDEETQLAKKWGEEYGRFQPTHNEPIHPLVEKLNKEAQLDRLRDAAQQIHPELPWSEADIKPGLIATTLPQHPDTKAILELLTHTFPDRSTFDSFFRPQLPQFLKNAAPNLSVNGISMELIKFMQRRNRLPELLNILKTSYPKEFDQHGPYERAEKEFEKQKREVKEKRALSSEATKVILKEIIQREAAPLDGLTLQQTLHPKSNRGIKAMAWIPKGTQLLSVSWEGVMQTWDIADGKEISHFQKKKNELLTFASPMPNGEDVLLNIGPLRKEKIRIQNLMTHKIVVVISGVVRKTYSIAISPDGTWAVSPGKGNSLQVWSLEKACELTTWHGHLQEVTQVLLTPDGKQVISGSLDETIKIWNTEGDLLHTLTGHSGGIDLLAISPDGRRLASVQKKSTKIFIWELPKQQGGLLSRFRQKEPRLLHKLTGHKSLISSLSFAANGRFLATKSHDYTVRLWQCDKGHMALQMMETLGTPIAFHPKRPLLATGGNNGKAIRIWELTS